VRVKTWGFIWKVTASADAHNDKRMTYTKLIITQDPLGADVPSRAIQVITGGEEPGENWKLAAEYAVMLERMEYLGEFHATLEGSQAEGEEECVSNGG